MRQKVTVRWDVGLNKKHLAHFTFARDDSSELRLMTGTPGPDSRSSLKALNLWRPPWQHRPHLPTHLQPASSRQMRMGWTAWPGCATRCLRCTSSRPLLSDVLVGPRMTAVGSICCQQGAKALRLEISSHPICQGTACTYARLRGSAGDELQLRHTCAGADMKPWKANGIVVRLADASDEVAVEMRGSKVGLSQD